MSKITRRSFIASAGALAAAPFAPAFIKSAHAAVALTLGHGAAPGNPRSVGALKFAELVAATTNGAVTINVAGSEQLGNDRSEARRVGKGGVSTGRSRGSPYP